MKYAIIYAVFAYLVSCADDLGNGHTFEQRIVRAAFWPFTLNSWLRSHPAQLHRLLTILWIFLIAGWFATLLLDRL